MKDIKQFVITAVATGAIFALAGCNTIEGIGKDLQVTGGAIETAAETNK